MKRHNIPTAAYQTFDKTQIRDAKKFLRTLSPPYVLKADGLAAGKGVVIPFTLEAEKRTWWNAGAIEVWRGQRTSGDWRISERHRTFVFVLTDGKSYKFCLLQKDYKRIGDGTQDWTPVEWEQYHQVPFADQEFIKKVEEELLCQQLRGLTADGIHYVDLFSSDWWCRRDPFDRIQHTMGDPETGSRDPRIQMIYIELFMATGKRKSFLMI